MNVWIPSLTTSAVLVLVFWLFRKLIGTRLTASVKHEFDIKLASVRSDLNEKEAQLKADLRAREVEIAALRSGAMTAMTSRQIALDARRLQAVDELWSAVATLGPLKVVAALMSSVKFDVAAEEAARSERLRQAFKAMGGGVDLKTLDLSGASKARPFVTPMVWAMFEAYQAVVVHSYLKLVMLQQGIANSKLINSEKVAELIKLALPHQSSYVEKYGDPSFYYLIDELESALLKAISAMLAGEETDLGNVERAAKIVRLADQMKATESVNPSVGGEVSGS